MRDPGAGASGEGRARPVKPGTHPRGIEALIMLRTAPTYHRLVAIAAWLFVALMGVALSPERYVEEAQACSLDSSTSVLDRTGTSLPGSWGLPFAARSAASCDSVPSLPMPEQTPAALVVSRSPDFFQRGPGVEMMLSAALRRHEAQSTVIFRQLPPTRDVTPLRSVILLL
jgi:hypothetical protein